MSLQPVICLLLTSLIFVSATDFKIFCYWNRSDTSDCQAWHIDLKLCTHLAFVFASVDETGAIKLTNEQMRELKEQRDFRNGDSKFKRTAPNLKLFVSVGDWEQGSKMFSNMISSSLKRGMFLQTVVEFLQNWLFDGIDLLWDYSKDRKNFGHLLEELKNTLDGHERLVSVAVGGRSDRMEYDISNITKNADIINLMLYNFVGVHGKRLAHNAPLHGNGSSVERAVHFWVKQSGDPSKLLLGIPFFGRCYTLKNPNKKAQGPSLDTTKAQITGYMGFNEFCKQAAKWQTKYDPDARVPYAFKGDQWLSFDNARSINEKLQLLKAQKLGGAMVWSIESDDFHGNCGEPQALLRVVNAAIGDPNVLTTEPPSTTEGIGLCPNEGFFRDAWNCQYYYECRDGRRIEYECLKNHYFDEKLGYCNKAELVNCPQNFITWRPDMQPYNWRNIPLNLKIVD